MDDAQRELLEELLLTMEQENKTFQDTAVKSATINLTYEELFDQINNNLAYGARCIKAYSKVKKYGNKHR